jgi:hypothetical protein
MNPAQNDPGNFQVRRALVGFVSLSSGVSRYVLCFFSSQNNSKDTASVEARHLTPQPQPLSTLLRVSVVSSSSVRLVVKSVEEPDEVIYTYDVKWVPSDLTWAHRWDVYLKGNPDDEIHYFSIVNR